MTPAPRILFVNRFYWPEEPATGQLLTDLAEGLAASGWSVTVITSAPEDPALPKRQRWHGVDIHRIRAPRLGWRGAPARAFDWMAFSLVALWRLLGCIRSGDNLVLLTDPPLLAVFATPLARWRGARVIHYIQDIYPELPELLQGTRGLGWLKVLRDRAWRQAHACVVLGRDMADFVAARGVSRQNIHLIPNWAPVGLSPSQASEVRAFKARWGLSDRFVVMYSGNLGRVHDLEPVLDVAAAMQSIPEVLFVFIGDGAQRPRLEAQVHARGLPNVCFLPPQPRAELAASLGAADVHLVTLRPGCEALVFPSKIYGIAAVARPVIFVGPLDCELARLVESAGMGRAFSRDNVDGIVAALQHWLHEPATLAACARSAAAFAAANGGLSRAVAAWRELLTQARHLPASVASRLQPPS